MRQPDPLNSPSSTARTTQPRKQTIILNLTHARLIADNKTMFRKLVRILSLLPFAGLLAACIVSHWRVTEIGLGSHGLEADPWGVSVFSYTTAWSFDSYPRASRGYPTRPLWPDSVSGHYMAGDPFRWTYLPWWFLALSAAGVAAVTWRVTQNSPTAKHAFPVLLQKPPAIRAD